MTNDATPYKEDGSALTFKATANVTGKRFVRFSANRTGGPGLSTDLANVYQGAHCGAGLKATGVSKWDAANGSLGEVHSRPGMVVPVTAGGVLAAGQEVQSDANGKAIVWDGTVASAKCGQVLNGAAADADAEIRLY